MNCLVHICMYLKKNIFKYKKILKSLGSTGDTSKGFHVKREKICVGSGMNESWRGYTIHTKISWKQKGQDLLLD